MKILLFGFLSMSSATFAAEDCGSLTKKITDAGVPFNLLNKFAKAEAESKADHGQKIVIVDFSSRANEKRFYYIDLRTGEVEKYLTSHGTGSDPEGTGFLKSFSNEAGKHATPKGLFKLSGPTMGKSGTIFRMRGVEKENAGITEDRGIAVQTCGQAISESNPTIPARSLGSFCLDHKVLNKLKGELAGALLYTGQSQASPTETVSTNPELCAIYGASSGGKPSSGASDQ